MARFDWEKANLTDKMKQAKASPRPRKKRKEKAVHPNSMAARKWGRKWWRT
jgi:hypothetical protein